MIPAVLSFLPVGQPRLTVVAQGWKAVVQSLSRHYEAPKDTIDFGYEEVPRSKKSGLVAEVFNSVADKYDVMNDLMSGGMHRLWKDRLVETLRPFPGCQHLDVAGGTGDVAFRILKAIRTAESLEPMRRGHLPRKQSSPGQVTLCDINESMLNVAKRKSHQLTPDGQAGLKFVLGNAESLPFDDKLFDSYTIAFGIRNVTDRDRALREAWRVLKPGGRFLCLEFTPVEGPEVTKQLYDLYSFQVIPQVGRLVANDEDSYRYLVESIRRFPNTQDFACMIEAAGFRRVQYETMGLGAVALHSAFKV